LPNIDRTRHASQAAQIHLIVVENWDERFRRPTPQIVKIDLRNQVGHHVRAAVPSEDVALEFGQPDGAELQSPQIPRGMQKIQMRAGCGSTNCARHAVARFEQRPVKRFAVEGDEHASLGHSFGESHEDGVLLALLAHEKLLDFEPTGVPPGYAYQKRIRPSASRKARGFRVEKEPLPRVLGLVGGAGRHQLQCGTVKMSGRVTGNRF
jgi:hypothetical protein